MLVCTWHHSSTFVLSLASSLCDLHSFPTRRSSDLSPLPRTTSSPSSSSLSCATVLPASPLRSVEFIHGSGSRLVRDATYFWDRLRTSVKGFSVLFGHTAKKSSYVRRPSNRPRALGRAAMLPEIASA